jgi:serine/threonine protein kinase
LHQSLASSREFPSIFFSLCAHTHTRHSDFGSTREVGEEISANYTKGVGTPVYMAPEVLDDRGYSMAADVYSFGILLHEMYTEKEPYSSLETRQPW